MLIRLLGRVRNKWLHRVWRSKLLSTCYLLAIVTIFALEHADEIAERIWGTSITNSRFLQPGALYQAITRAGYRHPRSHYVRLVTFDPDKEPQWLQGSECLSRSFEAKLLDAISDSHPALIALDEYFPEGDCLVPDPQSKQMVEDAYTVALHGAVQRLTEKGIPVVIAEYTLNYEEQLKLIHIGKLVTKDGFLTPEEVLLQPEVQFDGENEEQPLVTRGAAELEPDSRKIPIRWNEFYSQAEVDAVRENEKETSDEDALYAFRQEHGPFELYGLAAQVAQVYDISSPFNSELQSLDVRRENPFTSFLNEDQLIEFEALDLMCGKDKTPTLRKDKTPPEIDWHNCSPSKDEMNNLSGHIILVGDTSADDMHPSVIGNVRGLVLQANYIESLLDDRVLFPVPWPIELITSLVLFILIEYTFRALETSQITALGVALTWILISYLACYAIVLVFGYYMYIWVPGGVAVVGETINLLTNGRSKRHRQKRNLPSKKGAEAAGQLPK